MPETADAATELMILRVAKALIEIDCNKDWRGMIMRNAGDTWGDSWGLDPKFANFLARKAVQSIRTVE